MASIQRYWVGAVRNLVLNKTINVYMRLAGPGYTRPQAVMGETSETAKSTLMGRLERSFRNQQNLFGKAIMQGAEALEVTYVVVPISENEEPNSFNRTR